MNEMKSKNSKKKNYILCILCIAVFSLAGYSYLSSPPLEEKPEDTWSNLGSLKIGRHLTIRNTDNALTFLDSKDVLSASGLYYASWTMGDPEIYENSEGETVDLYDAQLYLVLGEYKSGDEAAKNRTKWLEAARGNYRILSEEEVTRNGQPYLLITYDCINEENPYHRGISAFGVRDNIALCIELTCRENFQENPGEILDNFLENCTYASLISE